MRVHFVRLLESVWLFLDLNFVSARPLFTDIMFPTSAFGQVPLGYPYPGQQQPGSVYQSQYGNLTGFNPQVPPAFQQAPQPRGQSAPNVGRQYPPTTGPYVPPAPTSSRRGQQGQYPPPAPSQHYEYRSTHTSKSKQNTEKNFISMT